MSEEALDGVQIDTGFEQVRGERMAQRMNTTTWRQTDRIASGAVESLDPLIVDRAGAGPIRKTQCRGRKARQYNRNESSRRGDRMV